MTKVLAAGVGDRVRFIGHKLPKYKVNLGWRDTHVLDGNGETIKEPIDRDWRQHFDGCTGMVDCIDIQNEQVRVRGFDKDRHSFTVWIEPRYLEVTERGIVEDASDGS